MLMRYIPAFLTLLICFLYIVSIIRYNALYTYAATIEDNLYHCSDKLDAAITYLNEGAKVHLTNDCFELSTPAQD